MLSLCRPAMRALKARQSLAVVEKSVAPFQFCVSEPIRNNFGTVVEKKEEEEDEDALSPIEQKKQDLQKASKHLLWESPEALPAPYLPEDVTELTAIDSADQHVRTQADGSDRMVIIRQDQANVKQSPLNPEKMWRISFIEDGVGSEKWKNSLMNWTSNADPYQSNPKLYFDNAKEAVFFAKKRGWRYLVKEPIMRKVRDDDRQYQDNFLPQDVAAKIIKEGAQCDHWQRDEAGTSHYFRPLRYHGNGVVRQHGPNREEESAPHVEGYYKLR